MISNSSNVWKILELWTSSIKRSKRNGADYEETSENDGKYWRAIDKIIVHSGFTTEALSWKGFDFALVKLSRNDYGDEDPKATSSLIAPACLAEHNFPDVIVQNLDNTFMAGFGRREIPYCMTDARGPEVYEVCGMKPECATEHRATQCSLEFLYNGETHNKCITSEPSPSSKDENCNKLRAKNKKLSNITVHLFDYKKKHITTCYPLYENGNSKGWCSIRRSGVKENTEPEPNKGWGFCSDDRWQQHCNGQIQLVSNMSPMKTSILSDPYCIDELKANLEDEQPNVKQKEFDPLQKQHKIICAGRNKTHSFKKEQFYIVAKNGGFRKSRPMSILKVFLKQRFKPINYLF